MVNRMSFLDTHFFRLYKSHPKFREPEYFFVKALPKDFMMMDSQQFRAVYFIFSLCSPTRCGLQLWSDE